MGSLNSLLTGAKKMQETGHTVYPPYTRNYNAYPSADGKAEATHSPRLFKTLCWSGQGFEVSHGNKARYNVN